MKTRMIETKRGARCRVLEGGSGHPLVFFHSAGGLLADNPFLDELAGRYHVFAPELPGYGESTGDRCLAQRGELRLVEGAVQDQLCVDGHDAPLSLRGAEPGLEAPDRPLPAFGDPPNVGELSSADGPQQHLGGRWPLVAASRLGRRVDHDLMRPRGHV